MFSNWLLFLHLVGTSSSFLDFDFGHFDVGVDRWNHHDSDKHSTLLRFSDLPSESTSPPQIFSPTHVLRPLFGARFGEDLPRRGRNLKQSVFVPEFTLHVNFGPVKKIAGHVAAFKSFAPDTVSPLFSFFNSFLQSALDIDDILDDIFEKEDAAVLDENIDSVNTIKMETDSEDDPALDDILDKIFQNDDVSQNSSLIKNMEEDTKDGNDISDFLRNNALETSYSTDNLMRDMEEGFEDELIDPIVIQRTNLPQEELETKAPLNIKDTEKIKDLTEEKKENDLEPIIVLFH